MVKLTGPAISLDASGSLKKQMTFRHTRGVNVLQRHQQPGGRAPFVQTYNQYMCKVYTSEAVRHWHMLSPDERGDWDDYISS